MPSASDVPARPPPAHRGRDSIMAGGDDRDRTGWQRSGAQSPPTSGQGLPVQYAFQIFCALCPDLTVEISNSKSADRCTKSLGPYNSMNHCREPGRENTEVARRRCPHLLLVPRPSPLAPVGESAAALSSSLADLLESRGPSSAGICAISPLLRSRRSVG